MSDGRVHQKASVAGEESAVFVARELYQLSIFGIAVTSDIYSEQTQIANKFPEMAIGNKASDFAHLQAIFLEMRKPI